MTGYVTESEINELKVRKSKEQMNTTTKSHVTFKKMSLNLIEILM